MAGMIACATNGKFLKYILAVIFLSFSLVGCVAVISCPSDAYRIDECNCHGALCY